MGFLLRWLFAFGLVTATYNPTQWSFAKWAFGPGEDKPLSLIALSGLVLLIGYIIYLRATLRSIGAFGMILILALVGTILWVAYDFDLLDLNDPTLTTWIGILAVSTVLGIGLSWSIVRRRLSGQADVDDIDE